MPPTSSIRRSWEGQLTRNMILQPHRPPRQPQFQLSATAQSNGSDPDLGQCSSDGLNPDPDRPAGKPPSASIDESIEKVEGKLSRNMTVLKGMEKK